MDGRKINHRYHFVHWTPNTLFLHSESSHLKPKLWFFKLSYWKGFSWESSESDHPQHSPRAASWSRTWCSPSRPAFGHRRWPPGRLTEDRTRVWNLKGLEQSYHILWAATWKISSDVSKWVGSQCQPCEKMPPACTQGPDWLGSCSLWCSESCGTFPCGFHTACSF